jgi:hypothetical protein
MRLTDDPVPFGMSSRVMVSMTGRGVSTRACSRAPKPQSESRNCSPSSLAPSRATLRIFRQRRDQPTASDKETCMPSFWDRLLMNLAIASSIPLAGGWCEYAIGALPEGFEPVAEDWHAAEPASSDRQAA